MTHVYAARGVPRVLETAGAWALGLLWILPGSAKTSDASMFEPLHKGEFELQAFVATISLGAQFGGTNASAPLVTARR